MIHDERIERLNSDPPARGRYVLYWMQQSQRPDFNHALEYAIRLANDRREPLLTVFGLTDDYPDANARHVRFMIEGLAETRRSLAERGIRLVIRRGPPDRVALELADRASVVVADAGYLRHQRQWRRRVAEQAGREVVQVESDVVVPVLAASDKAEFAARTIRPKILRQLDRFLTDLPAGRLDRESPREPGPDLDLRDPSRVLTELALDASVPPAQEFRGGASEARARLQRFLAKGLAAYGEGKPHPEADNISRLGPYLHFGQIAAGEVALAVRRAGRGHTAALAFLEQLIVRRELAINFVWHTPDYDSFAGVPLWARTALERHRRDGREHVYATAELEACRTHDPVWNALMSEIKRTGFLHNYMRMYWGKKILEWSPSAEDAYRAAITLNNRYFLDGRDPNSWTSVAWLFGLHDRPWTPRPVFGTIRYMSAAGLARKTDIEAFMQKAAVPPSMNE